MTIKRTLALALALCMGLVFLVGITLLATDDTRTSDPTQRRSWAKHPSAFEPLRSVHPARPEWPMTVKGNTIEVTYGFEPTKEQEWAGIEHPSVPGFLIPGGPGRRGLRLDTVAAHTRVAGNELENSGWCDPETWQPATPNTRHEIGPHSFSNRPGYQVFLELMDGDGELSIFSHSLFDLGTGLRTGNSTASSTLDEGFQLSASAELLHHTRLELILRYAYGEPISGRLDMRAGAKWTHGSHISLEFLHAAEGRKKSSGHGHPTLTWKWGPPWNANLTQSVVLLRAWPPEARHQIQVRFPGESNWSRIHNRYGVGMIDIHGVTPDQIEYLEVRFLPEVGISRMEVPCPPGLPKVDNLFDTPIPYLKVTREYELSEALRRVLGATFTRRYASPPSPGSFPMVFEQATVGDLWQAAESVQGNTLYWLEDSFKITDVRPDPWADLRKLLARFLP